jgi:hypothetical protein
MKFPSVVKQTFYWTTVFGLSKVIVWMKYSSSYSVVSDKKNLISFISVVKMQRFSYLLVFFVLKMQMLF